MIEGTGAIAELGLPLRVLAVVASTENMAGGGAFRPGDILTAMNGKTIEVINTDCEGSASCSPTRSGTRASRAPRTSSTWRR